MYTIYIETKVHDGHLFTRTTFNPLPPSANIQQTTLKLKTCRQKYKTFLKRKTLSFNMNIVENVVKIG